MLTGGMYSNGKHTLYIHASHVLGQTVYNSGMDSSLHVPLPFYVMPTTRFFLKLAVSVVVDTQSDAIT